MLDLDRLEALADGHREAFQAAEPFPHVVLDDFLPAEVAEGLLADFARADTGWKHYHHYNERKLALTDLERMPEHTRGVFEALMSRPAVEFVERLSGIDGLISDPDMEGAGMHRVPRGGHLNIHTDFLTHTKKRSWRRHINLLIYLNKDWQPEWNGDLELWSADMGRCVQSVAPAFNRCVVFNTRPRSYHGHPKPLACPEGECRRHILLYYYRDEGHDLELRPTDYRARPGDGLWKRGLVAADGAMLRLYTFLKGRTRLTDRAIDRILKHL